MPRLFLHACARTDHSVSEIIEFKSAAGSISFRSAVSQSCSIHACVGGHRRAAAAPRLLRWRCRRLAAALAMRLVGDIRHAGAVFHKVFGQENKPCAPVTSSQGARNTNVRPPNRAWEGRARPAKLAAAGLDAGKCPQGQGWGAWPCGHFPASKLSYYSASSIFPLAVLAALRGGRARVHEKEELTD